jgi:catechol 2,3-dioxygenase-like lactoylglutathione lyase family enzyme
MEPRVSLVTLGVADLERSRAFYEALGWHSTSKPEEDVVFFQSGSMVFALCSTRLRPTDVMRGSGSISAPPTASSRP